MGRDGQFGRLWHEPAKRLVGFCVLFLRFVSLRLCFLSVLFVCAFCLCFLSVLFCLFLFFFCFLSVFLLLSVFCLFLSLFFLSDFSVCAWAVRSCSDARAAGALRV